MFGPKDAGLRLPLHMNMYHGRRVICDVDGRELFKIDVIRTSGEAWKMLDEWGKAICDRFNSKLEEEIVEPILTVNSVKVNGENGKKESRSVDDIIVKRKPGRPRKT